MSGKLDRFIAQQQGYETCGSVNVYDQSRLFAPVAGKVMKAAVDDWGPWLVPCLHRCQCIWDETCRTAGFSQVEILF